MPIVTAYLRCNSLTPTGDIGDDAETFATFLPDYDDPRNSGWARWMPNLMLSMMLRGLVADQLVAGHPYTLTISTEEA